MRGPLRALEAAPSSSCIAPLKPDLTVDRSRISVAVHGKPRSGTDANNPGYSASVPKIFVFNGIPYMYWTVNRVVQGTNGPLMTTTTVRGAQLQRESGANGRICVYGSYSSSVRSDDGTYSVQVMNLDTNNQLLSGLADGFNVLVYGGRVLMPTGVGGIGCLTPGSLTYGCYRLEIRASTVPLGTNIFNTSASVVTNAPVPANPQEYSSFFQTPSGDFRILGRYFDFVTNGSAEPSRVVVAQMAQYPVDPASFQFGASSSFPQPAPLKAGAYLPVQFDVLQNFFPNCSYSNPFPNQTDGGCVAGVSRFCQSQGYSGGGLPQELYTDVGSVRRAETFCVTGTQTNRQFVNVSQINANYPGCNANTLMTGDCASAIAAFCRAQGASGGYGPLEHVGTDLQVTCLSAQLGGIINTTFASLAQQHPGCSSNTPRSMDCIAAAKRVCVSQGYLASYGIFDYYLGDATIGCIRRDIGV